MKTKKKEILHKVVSFVDREELDYLDEIMYDIYFSTEKKIPRSHVLRTIVHVAKDSPDLIKEIISRLKEEAKNLPKGGRNE